MAENEKETTDDSEQEEASKYRTLTDAEIDAIVRDPSIAGMQWDKWDAASDVDKDGKKFGQRIVLRKDCAALPFIVESEEGFDNFRATFGWYLFIKAANGTSIRVAAQQIVRTELLNKWNEQHAKNVTTADLRREVIKRVLLGQRAAGGGGGTRKVYIGADGKEYKTAEEAAKTVAQPRTFRALDGTEHDTMLAAKQASVAHLTKPIAEGGAGLAPEVAIRAVAGMGE